MKWLFQRLVVRIDPFGRKASIDYMVCYEIPDCHDAINSMAFQESLAYFDAVMVQAGGQESVIRLNTRRGCAEAKQQVMDLLWDSAWLVAAFSSGGLNDLGRKWPNEPSCSSTLKGLSAST